jgi:hypothetical protein
LGDPAATLEIGLFTTSSLLKEKDYHNNVIQGMVLSPRQHYGPPNEIFPYYPEIVTMLQADTDEETSWWIREERCLGDRW